MNTVRISLEFSGVILPVDRDEHGREVVPLKPISDVFGLHWQSQHEKVNQGRMLRRLGTCLLDIPYAGQSREMCCIRLDRVVAYLNSINPEKVRTHGNEDGADFLERKQDEWDDVLHAYESQKGGIIHRNNQQYKAQSQKLRDMISVMREHRVQSDPQIRATLYKVAGKYAEELGFGCFQYDLVDSEEGTTKKA